MAILDITIVIISMNVKLGKVMSIFQLVYEVGDEEEGVSVASSVFIEVVVVLAGMEFAILLLDKEEGGSLGRVGRSYLPCS